ncbi:MAG: DUF4249 domain-containing protein [Chitinophagaceae bacterium]
MNKNISTAINTSTNAFSAAIKIFTSKRSGIIAAASCLALGWLTGCEKVIDLKLNNAEAQYVIEGNVSNRAFEPAEVKISKTKNFNDDNNFIGVSGANVGIKVNNGTSYNLTESATGVYRNAALKGVPGNTYTLNVSVDGKDFSGTSTMPSQIVPLDTIFVADEVFAGSTLKTVRPSFLDPVGLGNSYRFIQYNNNVQVKKVFVQNDELSDGLNLPFPLFDDDTKLKSGDSVRLNMLCLDRFMYKYWFSVEESATGQGESTPTNPVTNIVGGALGYFSAHSVTSKAVIVP